MNFDFSYIMDQINRCCCGPYVPPCQRKPYYEDPRDVKPSADDWAKKFVDFSYGTSYSGFTPAYQSQPSEEVVELIQCRKCGVYFKKSNLRNYDNDLCDECFKDI